MIRFLKTLSLAGLAALVFTLGGCDMTSLNDNPNQPSTATTPNLLTNAQIDLADTYWTDYAGAFWVRYAQYWTTNQYTDTDRFRFPTRRSGSNNANWEDFYLVLNDLQEIKRINREDPQATASFGSSENQIAIAHIMQAFTLQMMTDMWGPIPLEEALQGRTSGNFAPAYSSQQAVYTAMIDSLSAASSMIDTGTSALSSGDLVYGGDMAQWKKLANALKMRVAMRMSDRMPSEAATAINEAIAAGGFASNDDNALIPFNISPPYQNPFYENYEVDGRDDWTIPQSILGVMNETEDPRRAAYFTDADPDQAGNQFIGFPYGLPGGEAQQLFTSESFSRPGLGIRQSDSPAIMMLYDEVLFIKAEAALRSDMNVPNISQSGQQLYRDAIRASMNRWGVTDASAISDFLSQVEMPTASNYRQVLGTQKWVAQYLQGMQGWSTWRRMDFEGVFQVPPPETAGDPNPGQNLFGCDIAVRMSYPNDEATLNEENLNSAINNLLGGDGASEDNQGVPLWWDTQAPVCN